MLFTSLQVVIKLSPLLKWEELEPKFKNYGVDLYETVYGHFLSDRQPSTLDKEVFAKTLAKVLKKLGSFRHDEGEDWQHALNQLEALAFNEDVTEGIIAEHFDKMIKD
jgi:hypothetical protein